MAKERVSNSIQAMLLLMIWLPLLILSIPNVFFVSEIISCRETCRDTRISTRLASQLDNSVFGGYEFKSPVKGELGVLKKWKDLWGQVFLHSSLFRYFLVKVNFQCNLCEKYNILRHFFHLNK